MPATTGRSLASCSSCAADIPEAARFCLACGAAVGEEHDSPTQTFHAAAPASSRRRQVRAEGERFVSGTLLAARYRIVWPLGKGGMGEVYKADDLRLGQPVALKFLPASLASDPARLARLAAEVRIARQVSHRNVCRVYDLGEAEGLHFLSMEYVDGEDLGSLLRRIGHLPQAKAIQLARQICAGLAAAHELGVLHRDLKPQNVMIDGQGRARLTDFGLAVFAAEQADCESAGTPAYMSPEQLAGRPVSAKSDLYALGLVLYEMFTGKPAFASAPPAEVARRRSESHPSRPSEHVPELDPRVERMILRCLESDPAARPASALAVSAALPGGDPLAEALAAGETPSPEMVAAAGEEGILTPMTALLSFAVALLLLGLYFTLGSRMMTALRVPLPKPPEVLSERAKEILRMAGHTPIERRRRQGFGYDLDYLAYVEEHDVTPRRWDAIALGRPAAVRFWYSSPESVETGLSGLVVLDTEGRLLYLRATPPARVELKGATSAAFEALIAAAGLDLNTLTLSAASFAPPMFADARSAWQGRFPGDAAYPLRVEAAALAGRPVYFSVLGPWQEPQRPPREPDSSGIPAFQYRVKALNFLALGGGVLLAWRNIRLGRGDRAGARRLAFYMFGSALIGWLLQEHHDLDPAREWTLFWTGFASALASAGVVWICYVAIEPAIRRRWPASLASWARLLAGRFHDPLVGRDLLVGSLVAWAALAGVALLHWCASAFAKFPPQPVPRSLDGLLGARFALARFMHDQEEALLAALLVVVGVLLLRAVVRRTWAAHLLLLLMVLAVIAGTPGFNLTGTRFGDAVFVLAGGGLMALVVAHIGLLAFAVSILFIRLEILPTWDLTAWYASSSRIGLALIALVTTYGFVTALAGRPLFKKPLLED